MKILIVCTGNICRSPAAEYLLRDATPTEPGAPTGTVTVASAGTAGMSGYPMDPRSLNYLSRQGIDGSGFTARRVNRRILQDADLVVGLEKTHVDHCLRLAPALLKRTFRLHQLAEWHRSGDLTSLTQLPHLRHRLPRILHDHADPVGFTAAEEYTALLDAVAEDVRALAALVSH
ncbi:protein tyrosine phosphatase [Corynebacterium glyciniphilum]|uniref:arsenate reductase/protein-tyrosine-phosphatase family protein n=1 Tax=Corynebacterium glyciniphilum TaxID=1404244 RepID=UPI00264CAAFB|nr:protein tyrosine phosphatase [Corynebacterium glyciniphilum]MDN5684082.1 protein tyrosine phosphatase [Corynebacterium glyciniphilum]MDN6706797.1 protein tyrosine phosphatase [Corynebacterium glyciniphilum]